MIKSMRHQFLSVLFLTLICHAALALTFKLPKSGNLIGEIKTTQSRQGDTLTDIAQREGLGALQIAQANPSLSLQSRLRAGITVNLPLQFLLPNTPHEGIVINVAELRLYYYPKDSDTVITEPVGIGREGHWKTPLGMTKVVKKEEDPIWHPTANVREDALLHGTPIPYAFPPGKDNPLGKYILRLGWPTYLIHGTNRPEGVGLRVSAGCIRMLPSSAKALYDLVSVGTKVNVIDKPYKLAWSDDNLYIEVHKPLRESNYRHSIAFTELVNSVNSMITENHSAVVQWQKLKQALKKQNGTPLSFALKILQ